MSDIHRPRPAWPTLSDATKNRARALALMGAVFLCAFSATIVLRLAIWLALLADGVAK
jgi:hypothetical protein